MKLEAAEAMTAAAAATAAGSPTSVLQDEVFFTAEQGGAGWVVKRLFVHFLPFQALYSTLDMTESPRFSLGPVKLESGLLAEDNGPILDDVKNGDSALISKAMAEEEKNLQLAREKEDSDRDKNDTAAFLMNNSHISKLDELLTQTQLYSEFLMEKMEDITFNGMENKKEETEKEKAGRGKKRKAKAQYNNASVVTYKQSSQLSPYSLPPPPKDVQSSYLSCQHACFIFSCLRHVAAENVSLLQYFDPSICKLDAAYIHSTTTMLKDGRNRARKAKTAVAAMLTRIKEGASAEDAHLTEEEKAEKEQAELIPLLTGGKLKTYQVKGVKWLISLWQNGLNGILADQMGLGKTVQTIGFLSHLKGKGLDGPYMVVAPLSTLSNWVNEVKRFVPSMNVIIYHGARKERKEIMQKSMPMEVGPNFPLIVTSYEVAMNDSRALANYKWKYVVVDEGHRLKNTHCKLLRELKRLPIENKLLLTGTPLQNNLAELWFDLSGKCSTDTLQEEVEEKRRVQVLIFSQMTKVLDIIDYYLSEKGHEVCRIDGKVKLDVRKQQIEEFNDMNSNIRIFLLSTRAGGLGINLTAADTCILYDSDWNPQMDLQAMDRCHRIGQMRPVHVYRLATSHSVEGRMLKKAFSKLKLEHLVIGKGQFKQERLKPNSLDESDLLALLRDEENAEDKLIQTDISDEDLARVLDRSDLVIDSDSAAMAVDPPPLKGPGWEVVLRAKSDESMLSAVAS
ncbi:hypothetical protein ACLOJK_041049 [Asimina triloba]